MSSHPTPEEVRASIVPKSDQLNADDLVTGPITVTITGVRRGDKDQPVIVDIEGHRPYKPCKSMRRVLISTYSDDPKGWVGQRMTLYCDPDVKWAGVKVGGIRISHLSGLDKPKTLLLTHARGKRAEVTIKPIVSAPEQTSLAPGDKCTNKAKWKVSPAERAPLALEVAENLYKQQDLAGLRGKLAKLEEIGTDFPTHDMESLRGQIQEWVEELELQHGGNDAQ